jgi:hypothetical protein
LLRGNGAKGSDQRAVNGAAIKQENTNYFLDAGFVGGGQFGCGVFGGCKLFLGSIIRSRPGMWRMLWCGRRGMCKTKEGSLNVAGHGYVDSVPVICPGEGEPTVFGARPIDFEDVVLVEDADQVINICFVDILDAKVIHYEGELDGASLVLPEARCDRAGGIPVWRKEFCKSFVGNDASLGKAIHAFLNAHIHMSMSD